MRELASVTGRRHDLFDRIPLGEAPLVLVGMGAVAGDALLAATTELRARGYDVGAVHLSAFRPFPGARLIKTLARSLAVTVLEPADEPLAQGGLLVRELKSAFTDAITWAPGFSGHRSHSEAVRRRYGAVLRRRGSRRDLREHARRRTRSEELLARRSRSSIAAPPRSRRWPSPVRSRFAGCSKTRASPSARSRRRRLSSPRRSVSACTRSSPPRMGSSRSISSPRVMRGVAWRVGRRGWCSRRSTGRCGRRR